LAHRDKYSKNRLAASSARRIKIIGGNAIANLDLQSQAPYGLVNMFAGYNTNGNWKVQLYGKNLADKGYYITTAANGNVPGGFVGAPRIFGIRVGYSF
jgi:outer membrane receptor protein involved in Fe transport